MHKAKSDHPEGQAILLFISKSNDLKSIHVNN